MYGHRERDRRVLPTEYGLSGGIRTPFIEEAAKPPSILNARFTLRLPQKLRQLGLRASSRIRGFPCEPSYYPTRRVINSPDNDSTIAAARPPVTARNTSSLFV